MFFYKNNIPRVKDNIAYCNWFNGVSMEIRILTPVESIPSMRGELRMFAARLKLYEYRQKIRFLHQYIYMHNQATLNIISLISKYTVYFFRINHSLLLIL